MNKYALVAALSTIITSGVGVLITHHVGMRKYNRGFNDGARFVLMVNEIDEALKKDNIKNKKGS